MILKFSKCCFFLQDLPKDLPKDLNEKVTILRKFQNQKLLIEKKYIFWSWQFFLLTVSMQKKQIFRLVAFSERSEHSNGIGRGKLSKPMDFIIYPGLYNRVFIWTIFCESQKIQTSSRVSDLENWFRATVLQERRQRPLSTKKNTFLKREF